MQSEDSPLAPFDAEIERTFLALKRKVVTAIPVEDSKESKSVSSVVG